MCPDAERLWREVIRLYRTYAPDEDLDKARQKYNDHLTAKEEGEIPWLNISDPELSANTAVQ